MNTVITEFTSYEERFDQPVIDPSDRSTCEAWLASSGFNKIVGDEQWVTICRNWRGFLAATALKPQPELAPNRKLVQWEKFESPKAALKRCRDDRNIRRKMQKSFWKVFDSLEGLTEKWPVKARQILNRRDEKDLADVPPFETHGAKMNIRTRRRADSIWTSLLCFLVYCQDEGSTDEMGLHLSEDWADNILDVREADVYDIAFERRENEDKITLFDERVKALACEMVTDPHPSFSKNPLMWWTGVLVRSAVTSDVEDYISRGAFTHNILPMDLTLRGRLAAIDHYSRVVVLDHMYHNWDKRDSYGTKTDKELNELSTLWLNADDDQRPSPEADTRSCTSPAWQAYLEYLDETCAKHLGIKKKSIVGQIHALSTKLYDPGERRDIEMADIDEAVQNDTEETLPEENQPSTSTVGKKRKDNPNQASAEEAYTVSRIMKRRINRKKNIEYLVEWEDYPREKDYTWEPAHRLIEDVPGMVAAFEATQVR
jgi:hypothetical protein